MISKCCENCVHCQKGFFEPNRFYCGGKSVQLVETKPDDVCKLWVLKRNNKIS